MMLTRILIALTVAAVTASAHADSLTIKLELPRLQVAEYHRPYVALWLQGESSGPVDLAVWYDTELADGEGQTWLKDLRQWWRRSGRSLTLPVDGLTGATRAPGQHTLRFDSAGKLRDLPAGQYELWVEAAREVGGRELLKIPFRWPVTTAETLQAQGEHELRQVELQLAPKP